MIFQGLFNILEIYSNEIDLFYDSIDQYFRQKIEPILKDESLEKSNFNNYRGEFHGRGCRD